jgi:hypothetical protein
MLYDLTLGVVGVSALFLFWIAVQRISYAGQPDAPCDHCPTDCEGKEKEFNLETLSEDQKK